MSKETFETKLTQLVALTPSLVLILAAALKSFQLSTSPSGLWSPDTRILATVLIQVELIIGFMLLSGWRPALARTLGTILFSIFAIASVVFVMQNKPSCSCFGKFELAPIHALVLDVLCIGFIWTRGAGNVRFQKTIAAVLIVSISCSLFLIANYESSSLTAVGNIIGNGSTVVLEPEQWVGHQFPLFRHCGDGLERCLEGEWEVYLYSKHCNVCTAEIDHLLQFEQESIRFLFLDISSQEIEINKQDSQRIIWRRLTPSYHWFANIPTRIRIDNGIVVQVLSR